MKKYIRKIWLLLVALMMIVPLFAGFTAVNAEENQDTSQKIKEIQIHKLRFLHLEDGDSFIKNDGSNQDLEFKDVAKLAGISFDVYDVTQEFKTLDESSKEQNKNPFEVLKEKISKGEISLSNKFKTIMTDKDGVATFDLKDYQPGNVYAFVEVDKENVKKVDDAIIVDPNIEGAKITDGIFHVYAKNSINLGHFNINKVRSDNGKGIRGVAFYLKDKNGLYYQGNKDVVGNSASPEELLAEFSSNEIPLKEKNPVDGNTTDGTFEVMGLPDGEYTLVEEQAADGYLTPIKNEFPITIKDEKLVQSYNFETSEGNKVDNFGNPKDYQDKNLEEKYNTVQVENIPLGYAEIEKQDKYTKAPLAGAEFKVYRDETGEVNLKVKDEAKGYAYAWSDEVKNDESYKDVILTSDGQGKMNLGENERLKLGIYYLGETRAPFGYVLPSERTLLIVTENGKVATKKDGKSGEGNQVITNVPKGHLPGTGGNGIVAYLAVGFVLVAGAGYYFIRKNKSLKA